MCVLSPRGEWRLPRVASGGGGPLRVEVGAGWGDGAGLRKRWAQKFSPSKSRKYFVNIDTGETAWALPDDAALVFPGAPPMADKAAEDAAAARAAARATAREERARADAAAAAAAARQREESAKAQLRAAAAAAAEEEARRLLLVERQLAAARAAAAAAELERARARAHARRAAQLASGFPLQAHCVALLDHGEAVGAVGFVEGQGLVSGGAHRLRLWRAGGGAPASLATFSEPARAVAIVALPAAGRFATAGGADEAVEVWDATAGGADEAAEVGAGGGGGAGARALSLRGSAGHLGHVTCVAGLSRLRLPGGGWVANWADAERVWGVGGGAGGALLASGGADGSVRVWNADTGAHTLTLEGPAAPVRALAVLPDGRLASGGDDGAVWLWAVRGGGAGGAPRVLRAPPPPPGASPAAVRALAVLDGDRLAAGYADARVRIWSVARCVEATPPLAGRGACSGRFGAEALAVLAGGLLACGSARAWVQVWDVDARLVVAEFEGAHGGGAVVALAALPGGRLAAAGAGERLVGVWTLAPTLSSEEAAAYEEARRAVVVPPVPPLPLPREVERARRNAAVAELRAKGEGAPAASQARAHWDDFCAAERELEAKRAEVRRRGAGARFRDGWSGPAANGDGWDPGPHEWLDWSLCAPEPAVVTGGFDLSNAVQGGSLISAISDVFWRNPAAAVFVLDNLFITTTPNPEGVVCVRLWVHDSWRHFFLDTTLPASTTTHLDPRGKVPHLTQDGAPAPPRTFHPVVTARSRQINEFWPSLLEKAWALLQGSYAASNGFGGHALNFLMPHSESFNVHLNEWLKGAEEPQWVQLRDWATGGWLLSAGTRKSGSDVGDILHNHMYSLLMFVPPPSFDAGLRLVKLRSPHGKGGWTGAYSNLDMDKWTPALREHVGGFDPENADDGVFFMPYPDMKKRFDLLTVTPPQMRFANEGGTWHKAVLSCVVASAAGGDFCESSPQFLLHSRGPATFTVLVRVEGEGALFFHSYFHEAGDGTCSLVESDFSSAAVRTAPVTLTTSPFQPVEKEATYKCCIPGDGGFRVRLEDPSRGSLVLVPKCFKTTASVTLTLRVLSETPFSLRVAQPGERRGGDEGVRVFGGGVAALVQPVGGDAPLPAALLPPSAAARAAQAVALMDAGGADAGAARVGAEALCSIALCGGGEAACVAAGAPQALVAALTAHAGSADVCRQAAWALLHLTWAEPAHRAAVEAAGAVAPLAVALKCHPDADPFFTGVFKGALEKLGYTGAGMRISDIPAHAMGAARVV